MPTYAGGGVKPGHGEHVHVVTSSNEAKLASASAAISTEDENAIKALLKRADAVFVTTSVKRGSERIVSIRASRSATST